jgi:hypothetical protein
MHWSIPLLRLRCIAIHVHAAFALVLVWTAYSCGFGTRDGAPGGVLRRRPPVPSPDAREATSAAGWRGCRRPA